DDADLSAFSKRGGKLLTWQGLADELIPPAGTVNYYERVIAKSGGVAQAQAFYRLYLLPGIGHGTPNGTSNPHATPPGLAAEQFYNLMTDWVEKGKAPENVILQGGNGKSANSMPMCLYPKKVTYRSGNPRVSASYTCSVQ